VTVLCLVERDADGLADSSVRLLAFARGLASCGPAARPPGTGLAAAIFGPAGQVPAGELGDLGVPDAYAIDSPRLAGYAPVAWARALAGLAVDVAATAVVAAASDRGSEVMAHLAAITGLPMAANCVLAEAKAGGRCRLVRQRWAGSLLEDATLEAPVALLTVAADAVAVPEAPGGTVPEAPGGAVPEAPGGAVPGAPGGAVPGAPGGAARVHAVEPAPRDGDLDVRAAESATRVAGISLATARVVVGGGRGVGGAEGFGPLEELAGLLGAAVGVSRVVTSQGWRPHTQQVGQTGTRIAPDLYLACGISGAIQHMAGCLGAKHIVAINTDPGAPIISRAEYAVIGDLSEVIPALIAEIRKRTDDQGAQRYPPPPASRVHASTAWPSNRPAADKRWPTAERLSRIRSVSGWPGPRVRSQSARVRSYWATASFRRPACW
jgi:electron transfer flavoprotein alpha subunit